MDKVYLPHASSWISDPINLKSYFNDFRRVLYGDIDSKPKKNDYVATMCSIMQSQLSEHEISELENYCSVEKLVIAGEPEDITVSSSKLRRGFFQEFKLPEGVVCNLQTVNLMKQPAKNAKSRTYMKYQSTIWLNPPCVAPANLIPETEFILTIRIYEPFKYQVGAKYNKPYIHCMYEIAVRGGDTLADFRDKLVCPSDLAVPGDVSENPYEEDIKIAKDMYKSGFLFFEDVFYNDFRDPSSIDYSAVIRKWAKEKDLGPFGVKEMETTKFEDLTIRLGYPYVYQHQGRCEHLVMFSDARLLHESDPLIGKAYPLYVTLGVKRTRYCLVCNMYVARWVTLSNGKMCVDPCYFCDKCFKSCNYKDGKKIGEFFAYRYYDRACII